ncbi:hypothetical protein VQH23_07595 [Pararoseomonas sp. SCSIO 73927]|uniref:hypothetical protein n=1 Tax=Pararoseomonas sp. SCSIO 73927 TaxID=3114537 RepID=UPI0030CD3C8F
MTPSLGEKLVKLASFLALGLLCGHANHALSQVPADAPRLGRAVEGVTVTLDANGQILFRVGDVITLEDGRELRRGEGGRYRLLTETDAAASPRSISGLDLMLQYKSLVGTRARVIGGTLIGAEARTAQLKLQGGTAFVRFSGAAIDAVREVVQNCSGFSANQPNCDYDIVGTIGDTRMNHPELTDVVLEPRRARPGLPAVNRRP